MKFQECDLSPNVKKSLDKLGFITPTPIQEEVLRVLSQGKDLMCSAETGSGKTGAYGINIVESLIKDSDSQALILAPTRELVHQIADFLRELTLDTRELSVISLVGGADMRKQLNQLKRNPRVVVATPGRLTDHLKRKSLNFNKLSVLVLDEGDRMLDMGFAPQLDEIIKFLPKARLSMLFTATLPKKVKDLAQKYLNNASILSVGETSKPSSSIKQHVFKVTQKDKKTKIVDVLNERDGSVIVFVKTKRKTDEIHDDLKDFGFKVSAIHGGRTQGQRNKALQNFRSGKTRILVATDVAARGLDVPSVAHVVNYDLPMMTEDFVHRVGRTGRNGKTGDALSFVSPNELYSWAKLVKKYQLQGVNLEIPAGTPREQESGRGQKKRSYAPSTTGGKRYGFKKRSSGSGSGGDSSGRGEGGAGGGRRANKKSYSSRSSGASSGNAKRR